MGDILIKVVLSMLRVTSSTPNTITWPPAALEGAKVRAEQTFQPLLHASTDLAVPLPSPKLVETV
jgi:hypothetical protein